MNKIIFQPSEDVFLDWYVDPQPSIKNMPEWYKEMQSYRENKSLSFVDGKKNTTFKKCIPALDALSSGYLIHTPCDIYVEYDKNTREHSLYWTVAEANVVQVHESWQIKGFPEVPGYSLNQVFKWMNPFIIKTPPGYSCAFNNPHLRDEPNFYSLSGVVDTDRHNISINFPFLIKNEFSGVIKRGTPIIQVTPFKRESWSFEIKREVYPDTHKNFKKINSKFTNFYKENFWSRKEYR